MDTQKPTLREVEDLIAFLPRLCETDFSPIKAWHGGNKDDDGIMRIEWPEYELIVNEFFKAASSPCWLDPEYLSKSASNMLDDENAIKTADLSQIKTMLTFCVRGERFYNGHWGAVVENGSVRLLLERLAALFNCGPRAG